MATEQQSFVDKRKGDTMINVVIGAAIAFFLPTLGHLIGGAVAGYLQQGSRGEGAKVGAMALLLATVPAILFGFLFAGIGILGAIGGEAAGGAFFIVIALVVVGGALLTAAVVGAIGGYVGAMLAEE